MLSSIKCEIKFDNQNNGFFYSGDRIIGNVIITNTKEENIRGVCLKMFGYIECNFSKSESNPYLQRASVSYTHFEGRTEYLKTKRFLIGSEDGNVFPLSIGDHTYNFNCILPAMMPTSFTGSHGKTQYYVTAKVHYKCGLMNKKCKLNFLVLKPYDLNDEPDLQLPIQTDFDKKSIAFGLFETEQVGISAFLEKSGYIPGENINITVHLGKCSNNGINLSLKQCISYISKKPYQTESDVEVVNIVSDTCISEELLDKIQVFNKSLLIPYIPPTYTGSSCIIKISYEVQIELLFSLCKNLIFKIPIVIGTLPLNMENPIGGQ